MLRHIVEVRQHPHFVYGIGRDTLRLVVFAKPHEPLWAKFRIFTAKP